MCFQSEADCSVALLLEYVYCSILSVQASIYTFKFIYTANAPRRETTAENANNPPSYDSSTSTK